MSRTESSWTKLNSGECAGIKSRRKHFEDQAAQRNERLLYQKTDMIKQKTIWEKYRDKTAVKADLLNEAKKAKMEAKFDPAGLDRSERQPN